MSDDIASFEEFWPFYVREHAKKTTRWLHFAGTTMALSALATGILTRKARYVLLAPALGYGPAWIGHFLVERNRPATFKYPRWSLQADFVMYAKMWAGTMDAEVERVGRDWEAESNDAAEQADQERPSNGASAKPRQHTTDGGEAGGGRPDPTLN